VFAQRGDDGALFRVQLPTCPTQCNQKGTDDEPNRSDVRILAI
jgi:hypothetical protein